MKYWLLPADLAMGLPGFFGALMYQDASSKDPPGIGLPPDRSFSTGVIILAFILLGETINLNHGDGISFSILSIC